MEPEHTDENEPRDYSRYLWIGIGVVVILMILAIAWSGAPDPNTSQVRARHILIRYDPADPADRQRALDLITDLREQLMEGADFATLAREYSEDPTNAARGGDLGYYPRGQFEPEFERYVWTGEVGEISEIVPTAYGFHLIRIEDRYISPGDEFEQSLEERVREEDAAEIIRKKIEQPSEDAEASAE